MPTALSVSAEFLLKSRFLADGALFDSGTELITSLELDIRLVRQKPLDSRSWNCPAKQTACVSEVLSMISNVHRSFCDVDILGLYLELFNSKLQ